MTDAEMAEEVIVCGRLPRKVDGSVDLYKVDRLLRALEGTASRVAVLRRLLETDK